MTVTPKLEFESQASHELFQNQALQTLLQYVHQNSRFYQQKFKASQIDLQTIASIDQLSLLPFTTKEDIQLHQQDFICIDKEKIIEYTATTGTLGQAVTIPLSQNDITRLTYNEALSFELMEATPTDTVQLLLTLDRQFMAGMAYYLGLKSLGITSIRTGPGLPAMQLDVAQKLKSTIWVSVPSFLLKIIDYAQQNQINLNELPVKKILCIGENIRDEQLAYNSLAKKILSHWKVQLFSTYASTEMQTAFTECAGGNGAHYHPELLLVEIVDDEDQVLPPGKFGEVVITTLGIEAMPLIRYRTGDIACLFNDPCTCGRTTYRLSPIVGRKKQMIKFKGTTIYPPALFDMLQSVEGVQDYAVEVKHNEHGQDIITLYVHSILPLEICEKKLKPFLKTKLRFVPELVFVSEAIIQQMYFGSGSRKAQKFIDLRNPSS